MALYKGTKRITPLINKALTIKNQDKTIVENGTYTADEGFTGLGNVTVKVPNELREETTTVTTNNSSTILTPSGFQGYKKVTVKTAIPTQDKKYTITEADLSKSTITIKPDTNYSGMTSVTLDLSVIINALKGV